MSANVISHQAPRRKRAGVLIVTLAGVIAASWLAVTLQPPMSGTRQVSAPIAPFVRPQPAPPAAPANASGTADLAGPPLRRAVSVRAAPRPSGIPLDAGGALEPAGYEILSAAELEDISQARD